MKWIKIPLAAVLIAGIIWVPQLVEEPTTKDESLASMPAPTDVIQVQGRKEFREKRQAWLEKRHGAAAGTDWRKMDEETREEIRQRRNSIRQDLYDQGGLRASGNGQEVLANGHLVGTWEEKGSKNLAGRMHVCDVDFDNDIVFAGSAGNNVWTGSLDGTGWTSLNDFLPNRVDFLRYFPNGNSHRLMIAGNKKFLYSDNDGITWTDATGLEDLDSWGSISRVVIPNSSPTVILVLALEWDYVAWGPITSVFRSDDLGVSFTRILSVNGWSGSKDIWTARYGTSGNAYLIDGTSFNQIDLTTNSLVPLSTIPGTGNTILTGTESSNGIHISARLGDDLFRSDDGGQTWTFKGQIPENPFRRTSINSSVLDPDKLYFGGVDTYTSSNGGITWNKVNNWWEYYGQEVTKLHADIPAITVLLDNNGDELVMIGTDGGLYKSYDQINNVENISLEGLGVGQYYSTYTHRTNPNYIYLGSQDQGFQRSSQDNGGLVEFDQTISGDYGSITSDDGGQTFWTVYPSFAMHYPNASTSTANQTWDFVGNGWQWMSPLMVDPGNPSGVYIGGGDDVTNGQYIWHLQAGGPQISATKLSYDFSLGGTAEITALAVSPIDGDYRYVLTDIGRFFYTTDGGNSWNLSPASFPDFHGNDIEPSRTQLGTVYFAGSGYSNPGVFVSTDNGQTLTAMDTDLPSTGVNDLVFNDDESMLFAATEVGPYVYVFSESKWYEMAGISAPDQRYTSVDFIPISNTARFGTYGRGAWDFDIQCLHPSNLAVANITTSAVTLSWVAVPGGGSHDVRYRRVGTANWTVLTQVTPPLNIGGLSPGKEYEFQVMEANCGEFSASQTFTTDIGVGVQEIISLDSWELSPVPAKDFTTLTFDQALKQPAVIHLLDLQGKSLSTQNLAPGTLSHQVDISALPVGVYVLQIQQGNKRSARRLVKSAR